MRAAAVLLCLALSPGVPAVAQPAPGQTVSGVVVSAASGEALARVRVDGPGDPSIYPDALTDDRGRFTLRVPAEPAASLRLTKAGFAAMTTTLPAREASAPMRLQMERGAAISGRIIATNGTPMRTRVYVLPEVAGSVEPTVVLTDDRGEFRAGGLPQGRYIVAASQGVTWTSRVTPDGERQWVPYLGGAVTPVPARPPDGWPRRVVIARAGEEAGSTDFTFEIVPPQFGGATLPIALQDQKLPPGSVSGTVVDERGAPMQGAIVRLQRLRTINGRTVARTATDPVTTDDRGRFRAFALPAGEYVVSADVTARLGGPREYTATYAGGGFDLDSAARWLIGESEETGVGIEMIPAELFSVDGVVRSSSGAPGSGRATLTLTYQSGRPIPEARSAPLGADGRFAFDGVPPGDYVVQANIGGTLGTPAEFGVAFVAVGDAPRAPVVVTTTPPSALSGRILVERDTPDQRPSALSLRLLPADPDRALPNESGIASLATSSDGSFYVTGLAGRTRIVLAGAADGWFMKELLIGDSDVAAEPFDFGEGGRSYDDAVLVMSPRGAVVTGRPDAERDGPLPPYWAIVFPTDRGNRVTRSQFIKHARSGDDGTFRVTSLAPGSYYVATVRTLELPTGIDEWQPAELERLAGVAMRVTIAEGETRTVRPRLSAR